MTINVTKEVLPDNAPWSADIDLVCDDTANDAAGQLGCVDPGTLTATNNAQTVTWTVPANYHYILTESAPAGWVAGEFTCNSSSLGGSIGSSLGGSLGGALTDSAFTLDTTNQFGTTVDCNIVNYKPIKLTVNKTVYPLSTPDWSYDFSVVCDTNQVVSGCVDPTPDTTGTATKAAPTVTWTLNPPYHYVLTEDQHDPGSSPLGFECSTDVQGPARAAHTPAGVQPEPDPTTPINANPAEVIVYTDVTCDITNLVNSRLFLQKQTHVPGGPFKFDVSVGGNSVATPIITTVTPDTPTPSPATEIELPFPGDVAVTETQMPDGYYQKFVHCTLLTPADQVALQNDPQAIVGTPIDLSQGAPVGLGNEVRCLFDNEPLPILRVTKHVIPASNTSWAVQFFIEPAPPDGQPQTKLATAAAPTVGWQVLPGETYTITEILPPGYQGGSFTCIDANSQGGPLPGQSDSQGSFGNIDMSLFTGDVNCDITNIGPPVVNIYKWTVGKPGGPFTFNVGLDGNPVGTAQVSTSNSVPNSFFPGQTSFVLPGPGTATVTEDLASLPTGFVNLFQIYPVTDPDAPVFCEVTRFDDADQAPIFMPDSDPLRAGDELNCLFINVKLPTVTVTKHVAPAGETGWSFPITLSNIANGGAYSDTQIATSDDPTVTFIVADAALIDPNGPDYDLSEVLPPGWEAGQFECTNSPGDPLLIPVSLGGSNGGQTTTLDVNLGDDWTCDITNFAPPKVKVAKTTNGGTGTFNFTVATTGNATPESQDITTDADGVEKDGTPVVTAAGDITVSETPVPGWYPSNTSLCVVIDIDGLPTLTVVTDQDRDGSITVPGVTAGQTLDCSFVNDKAASLTITKSFRPSTLATWSVDFTINPAPPVPQQATQSANQGAPTVTWTGLDPTVNYTVTESNIVPASAQKGTVTCAKPTNPVNNTTKGSATVDPAPGEALSCEVTNLAAPRVLLQKITVGQAGGPFGFLVTNGVNVTYPDPLTSNNPVITTQNADTAEPVPGIAVPVTPGSVYVRENTLPAGWTFTKLECTKYDAAGVPAPTQTSNNVNQTLNTILGYGEEYRCVATNTSKASVTVTKTVLPAGTAPWTASFKISPTPIGEVATKVASDVTPVVSWTGLTPGVAYTITETGPAGFTQGVLDCPKPGTSLGGPIAPGGPVGTATFTPVAGEAYQCTITNIAPPKVFIQKETIGGSGGQFAILLSDSSGPKPTTYIWTEDADEPTPGKPLPIIVQPGTITVSEPNVPSGWERGDIVCAITDLNGDPVDQWGTMGGPVLELTVNPGDTVRCLVTNIKLASASVTKTVQGPAPWSFKFTISPVPAGETATKTATNVNPTVTWNNLDPGTQYEITEETKAGYQNGEIECTGATSAPPGPGRRVSGGNSGGGGLPSSIFTPASGDQVNCSVTNQALSKLTVTKVVTPVTSDNWSFVVEVRDSEDNLVGKRTLTKALPSATFDNLDPDEQYTVTELPSTNPRFETGGITCSNVYEILDIRPTTTVHDNNAENGVTFQLPAGGTGACVIDNTRNETNLELTKNTDSSIVGLGTTVTWTIWVHNAGNSPADNVVVNDVLPATLDLISVTPAPGWDCSSSVLGNPGVVNCTKTLFAIDEEATFTVVTRVNDAIAGDPIVNTATVSTDTDETTYVDNSDGDQVTIEDLPATGADTGRLVIFGVSMLTLGLFLLGATKRRKTLTV